MGREPITRSSEELEGRLGCDVGVRVGKVSRLVADALGTATRSCGDEGALCGACRDPNTRSSEGLDGRLSCNVDGRVGKVSRLIADDRGIATRSGDDGGVRKAGLGRLASPRGASTILER